MAFFKAICAKGDQKIELIIQYETLDEAKFNLHKQGYAISEIKEVEDFDYGTSSIFYFDIILDWQPKTGQINSSEIFKAYIKLVEWLKYNVIYIYDKKDCTENEKILITQKIKHSYNIYKKDKPKIEEIKDSKWNKISKWESDLSEFIMKDLNNYYLLIDKIFSKIDHLLNNYKDYLSDEKSTKLHDLYNALKQVKNITNITKLKNIWEKALIKIWELQLELIEKNILDWKKEILLDTNKLLKWFWSSKKIILPEDDINYKIKSFFNDITLYFKWLFNPTARIEKIDKNSWKYFDILRELKIYNSKLKNINKEILKNIFNREKYKRLTLKKKLIEQNIALITNRIRNQKISYIKTIKWIEYYYKVFIYFIQKTGDLIIYSLLIYSIFFIFYISIYKLFNIKNEINFNSILYITIFALLGFLLKISKNLTIFVISIFIYILSFIYLVINF